MKLGEDGWYHADDSDRIELIEIFHELLLEDLIVEALEHWLGVSPLPEFIRKVAHEEAVRIYTETQKKKEEKGNG